MATDQLPALPEPKTLSRGDEDGAIQLGYTADQMHAYALAAIAADHARAVPARWEWRLRPSEDPGNPWTEWRKCTEEQAKEILASNTTRHEVRALYTRPPAPEQPAEPYHLSLAEQGALNRALRRSFKVLDPAPGQPADLSGQAATAAGERERFEAWAAADGFNIHRDESDKYRDYHRATTRFAWRAWQARASLSTPASGEGWMPIETAPRDGTNVLLVNRKGNIAAGLWIGSKFGSGWYLRGGNTPDVFFNDHHGPTHWRPLPPAPTSPTEPAAEGEA